MRIGILGATGPAGRGLAARLASVGHEVLFGSREVERAKHVVAWLIWKLVTTNTKLPDAVPNMLARTNGR